MIDVSIQRWDKNVVGKKFNRLTIESYSHTSKWRQAYFVVKCDCGRKKTVRMSSIINGKIKSCGCYAKEVCPTVSIRHGHSRDGQGTAYRSWLSMNNRCYCPSNPEFENYGGRGIYVCERWRGEAGFTNFLLDMGERPSGRYSIDRVDNDGIYEPSNCRWATSKEQHRNKSTNVMINIGGEVKCLKDWCFYYNINYSTVQARIRKGQTPKLAIIEPARRRNQQ